MKGVCVESEGRPFYFVGSQLYDYTLSFLREGCYVEISYKGSPIYLVSLIFFGFN